MGSWTDEVRGRLGFGCMRLPGGPGGIDRGEMSRMVDAFLGAGFNYFDTAHVYHGGKCERECPQRLPIRDLLDAVSAEFD